MVRAVGSVALLCREPIARRSMPQALLNLLAPALCLHQFAVQSPNVGRGILVVPPVDFHNNEGAIDGADVPADQLWICGTKAPHGQARYESTRAQSLGKVA
jgi:hemolysin-activating ACP:hemolysin acyltransferase